MCWESKEIWQPPCYTCTALVLEWGHRYFLLNCLWRCQKVFGENSEWVLKRLTLCRHLVFDCFFPSIRETTCRVANEVTGNSNWMLILTSTPGPMALHPLQRKWCKLQAEVPSEYTYSHFRAELSILLGENPCCYSGAGTWDPWFCSPAL